MLLRFLTRRRFGLAIGSLLAAGTGLDLHETRAKKDKKSRRSARNASSPTTKCASRASAVRTQIRVATAT
jgi:hypothetical protein